MIARAERARPGHTATVHIPDTIEEVAASRCSSFNLLFPIEFDDGVVWLLRVPTYDELDQITDVVRRIKHSEVLTHFILREAGLPVPKIEDWGIGAVSRTGSEYLLTYTSIHSSINVLTYRPQVRSRDGRAGRGQRVLIAHGHDPH